jgi:hypothetical protein
MKTDQKNRNENYSCDFGQACGDVHDLFFGLTTKFNPSNRRYHQQLDKMPNQNRRSVVATMTCSRFSGPIFAGKFQFSGKGDSGRWTGKSHEEIEVHGSADRVHPAAG